MGEPLAYNSAEGVSSNLCFCHDTGEKAGFEHRSCAHYADENFETGVTYEQDDLAVEEIGTAFKELMRFHNGDEFEGSDCSDSGEFCDENDDPPLSPHYSTDDVGDVETEVLVSADLLNGNATESSIGKSDDGNSSSNGTPKLVSAMKGSRAKRGIVSKLTVSWAPDVYDPPVTSESHTVKGSRRSSRKDYYKYKSSNSSSSSSRSSKGSKKDKKHPRHSSNSSGNRRDKHSYHTRKSGANDCRTAVPLVPVESASLTEVIPIFKTMEQLKCSSSYCKEQPLTPLSRQLVAPKYKGMFAAWNQNQLAS